MLDHSLYETLVLSHFSAVSGDVCYGDSAINWWLSKRVAFIAALLPQVFESAEGGELPGKSVEQKSISLTLRWTSGMPSTRRTGAESGSP